MNPLLHNVALLIGIALIAIGLGGRVTIITGIIVAILALVFR